MNEFLLILGMALVTFGVRYPVLVLVGKIPLPDQVFRALRYVPPAVLAAIILPSVLMPTGEMDVSFDNAYLVGGIAAVIIAYVGKNLLVTIVLGMAGFLAWRFITGGFN